MKRSPTVAVCLLLAAGSLPASAQSGRARGHGETAVPTAPASPGPAADAGAPSPVRSRLRFDPGRQPETSHRPGVVRHSGQGPFGVITLWPVVPLAPPPIALPLPAESGLRGGVQLDVQPWRAQVYVDGVYAGTVEDFKGYYNHLELTAGPHVLTIAAPDHQPLTVEVTVIPGRTITHRATLTRN